ncbi:MAG: AAA family ATPase [Gammaproteobacteria bacterium]|jgi:general secretion pathway protein A
MYRHHFGLQCRPFSITPDPRFLYMSARHREALAHLLYGVGESGGFVQLTGEVGTGKTTVCRCLLEQAPDDVAVALILNPRLDAVELLATICDELGVAYPEGATVKQLVDRLNAHLLDAHGRGRRTVLVIDEAQNLSAEVLEQVRLLTNLETTQDKLLQVILIGQPELKQILERSDLRQLAQRITARYHLEPLSFAETRDYVRHRLRVAGASGRLFTDGALREIQARSAGVPRLINVLCDRALLGAYVEEKKRVDRRIVRRATREVLGRSPGDARRIAWLPWAGGAALLIVAAVAWSVLNIRSSHLDSDSQSALATRPVSQDGPIAIARADEARSGTNAPTASPIPPSVPPAADSLPRLLADAGADARDQAWQGLFALWQLQLPSAQRQGSPCRAAAAHGLRCLSDAGSWSTLRNIDRPAILELVTSDGRRVPVLLQHLDDTVARVRIAGHVYNLPVSALQQQWYGDYTVLWRPPVASAVLKVGDNGPDVRWLRAQLQRVLGAVPPVPDPDRFDSALEARVERFQRRHALRADGIVGGRTLIQLNSAADRADTPRLCAKPSKPA